MAPTAAELFKQATDRRARFTDGKQGVSKQNETREFGQPYLRSWWPDSKLKLQRMRTSKFWVCGCVFFLFFKNFFDQQLHMAHGCQDACCKEGYRKEIYVCGVSSPLFSFAVTHLHCCQDQQNERMAALKLERKKWPIRASKRQIVKWQFFSVMTGFPHEIASLGFSGYVCM